MDGFADLVMFIFEADDFGIDVQHEPIGGQRSGVEGLGLLLNFSQDDFEFLG